MAKTTAIKVSTNPKPKTYTVAITAMAPVAFVVPGIRKVRTGDTIIFHNKIGGPAKISVAADKVLKGVKPLKPQLIQNGKKRAFEVVAESGTHEFSVHYSYWDKRKKRRRTGFAIGASSPKIIIVR